MFDIVTRDPSVVKGAESPLCVNKTYKFFFNSAGDIVQCGELA